MLDELFEDEYEFSSVDVSDKLYDGYHIRIRSPTIEKLIKKYRFAGKLDFLDEIEPGVYRLRPEE